MILQDVADAEGDVDSWLTQYRPEQLTYSTIAPSAATLLLAAGRPEGALRLIEAALPGESGDPWFDTPELDEAHFACLEALDQDDLRAALWSRFERRHCPDALRRHLKRLPGFEDIEAEDAARRIVRACKPVEKALAYCLQAPDQPLAAELIEARSEEINGDVYEVLTPLADALVPYHPLAAVLLWRAMIDFALGNTVGLGKPISGPWSWTRLRSGTGRGCVETEACRSPRGRALRCSFSRPAIRPSCSIFGG
ncbi:hypothetical protein Q4543_23680 [Salipiger sp. 1_MG-2023]|uniref:DUF6880 family protein n=1 Tax=Salipiger sp. 1_MG-2023 TaxID=3062665 RepID=UPI0026E17C41|nr:DUF6880 family protein [Salipiger sp. 1_MG-2023]MDO6588484.1 hypothetical protein [Salipiger sp. 1_MG-2023]